MHVKKIIKKLLQDLQTAALRQCMWERPILEGSLILKPTEIMNYSPFFSLGRLAYKLVNLFVLKRFHVK